MAGYETGVGSWKVNFGTDFFLVSSGGLGGVGALAGSFLMEELKTLTLGESTFLKALSCVFLSLGVSLGFWLLTASLEAKKL